jgi:hypothetical protein
VDDEEESDGGEKKKRRRKHKKRDLNYDEELDEDDMELINENKKGRGDQRRRLKKVMDPDAAEDEEDSKASNEEKKPRHMMMAEEKHVKRAYDLQEQREGEGERREKSEAFEAEDGLDVEFDTAEDKAILSTDEPERLQPRLKGRLKPSPEELNEEAIWITERLPSTKADNRDRGEGTEEEAKFKRRADTVKEIISWLRSGVWDVSLTALTLFRSLMSPPTEVSSTPV